MAWSTICHHLHGVGQPGPFGVVTFPLPDAGQCLPVFTTPFRAADCCAVFTMVHTRSVKTVDDLVTLWAISKSGELARLELYVQYATTLARNGELIAAKDVALETVGHVSVEDPRVHLLLGELGVALRDARLTQEAIGWLRLLKLDQWEHKLHEVVASGSATFSEVP